jgi:hypothetical protein
MPPKVSKRIWRIEDKPLFVSPFIPNSPASSCTFSHKKIAYDQNISCALIRSKKVISLWIDKKKFNLTLVSRQMNTLPSYFQMMQQVQHDVGIF